MPRNFNLGIKRAGLREPRVVARAVLGVLLAANLVGAVVAFKPFGGSADDLRSEQGQLSAQLQQLETRLAAGKRLVEKVETARAEGDQFITRYFMDEPTTSATIMAELTETAKAAGIRMGQAQFNREPIEGSDNLFMLTAQVGFDGSYGSLTKFVNLLDKSPRFMIIENMQANAPQQQAGQSLNVTLKVDSFVRGDTGAGL
jgi:type IV pilus assembly protein PilO